MLFFWHRHAYTAINNTPIYNKYGKQIKTVKMNKKYVFPAKYNKKFDQYHYNPRYFFNIGKGRYLLASDIGELNSKPALYTNYNSYIYKRKGQKTGSKIPKGMAIVATKSLVKFDKDVHPIFYTWDYSKNSSGQEVYLPYITIKKQQYYQIGKNQYIKANNVGKVAGNEITVNKAITTTLTKNSAVYAFDRGEAVKTNKKSYKKGQKIVTDYQVADYYYGESEENGYYHIKGKGNEFIYGGNIKTRYELNSIVWSEFHTLQTSALVKADKQLNTYNLNGKRNSATIAKDTEFNVDQLCYIYVPGQKRTELFHHVTEIAVNGTQIGNVFIKASDVTYIKNAKLKAVNTSQDAKNDAMASENSKQKLQAEIAQQDKLKKRFEYTESSKDRKEKFDLALNNAESIAKDTKASQIETEFALWYLQSASADLDGEPLFS